jgi:N-acetylornithine carbamoyltransferase
MEVAAAQLGAYPATVTPGSGVWSMAFEDGAVMDGPEAEHVREAAGVLSRYYDAIGVRLFASMTDLERDRTDRLLHRFADAATVPVVNLESAFWHPCQELADAATIQERFGGDARGRKFVLSWSYHPRALPMAVPNSAIMMAARLGMDVMVARPEGYALDPSVMELAREEAGASGGTVRETDDRAQALEGADIVYAKAWAGTSVYTHADAEAKRRGELRDWRVTAEIMRQTRSAAFMHCLPVRRNVVVDDDVLDGPDAIHLLQAEYRLHAQKAILEMIWGLDHKAEPST